MAAIKIDYISEWNGGFNEYLAKYAGNLNIKYINSHNSDFISVTFNFVRVKRNLKIHLTSKNTGADNEGENSLEGWILITLIITKLKNKSRRRKFKVSLK